MSVVERLIRWELCIRNHIDRYRKKYISFKKSLDFFVICLHNGIKKYPVRIELYFRKRFHIRRTYRLELKERTKVKVRLSSIRKER
jgi:hypothetical protein